MDEKRNLSPETIAAIEEVQKMKEDPSIGKSYTDVSQLIRDLSE